MALNEQQVTTLKQMHAAGASLQQIAEAICATRGTVSGKLHRLGLMRPRPSPAVRAARASAAGRRGNKVQAKRMTPLRLGMGHPRIKEAPAPLPSPLAGDKASKTLLQLKHHDCRWPIGDPRAPEFGFCGDPAKPGKPYCPAHLSRAFIRNPT